MSFHMKLDKDCPKDTILFVPNEIKCSQCKRHVPIQQFCIKCGEEFTPGYIGCYVTHMSRLLSVEIQDHYRSKG